MREQTTESRPPDNAELILLVDDDEAIRALFRHVLRAAGYRTIEAASAEDAARIIEGTSVSLVLLDDHMPGTRGSELVTRLRADRKSAGLPIILVSGEGDDLSRVAGLEVGADDYIAKPVHLPELLARVRGRLRQATTGIDLVREQYAAHAQTLLALTEIHSAESLDRTTLDIVSELATRGGHDFVAVLEFGADGKVTPLAHAGRGQPAVSGGQSLPGDFAAGLRRQGKAGPWASKIDGVRSSRAWPLDPPGLTHVAYAPIRSLDTTMGLVVIATRSDRAGPIDELDRLLAAVIDYAAIVGPVIVRLVTGRPEASTRSQILDVLFSGTYFPVYQPVWDMSRQAIVGYEALTRFEDGTAPNERFDAAERLGVGSELEQATLARAITDARLLPAECWLSLNISPMIALSPELLATLRRSIDRPLVFELTEHVPIDDYDGLREILNGLAPETLFAVDDAGAGFASLRHILELAPHFVKLDMSLVRAVDQDPVRQALVAGIVHFGSRAHFKIIAEGVETQDEATTLRNLGIELAQGYLFGRPARPD